MANFKNTFDELIRYNEQKKNELISLRDRHIKEKQVAYYDANTKHAVIKLDAELKDALAEIEKEYLAKKTEFNKLFEQKRAKLIETDYAAVAATEGAAFDSQIAILENAIATLKGGNV